MTSRITTFVIALVLASSMWLVPSRGAATVMVEVSLEDMVRDSDVIVRGVVTHTGVQMALGLDGLEPHTVTTLRVDGWLKGNGGATVTVRELGGITQDTARWIDGTPRYREGEEVVVFLRQHPEHANDFRTYGMAQGHFTVLRGVPGTPSVVIRDLEGIAFARFGGGHTQVTEANSPARIQLEALLELIADIVGLDR